MTTITELKNGVAIAGDIFKFEIEELGKIIVSNQALDATPYEGVLLTLRRASLDTDSDYVEMKPALIFDNDNNYQILGPGKYAFKVTISANIIVAVEK